VSHITLSYDGRLLGGVVGWFFYELGFGGVDAAAFLPCVLYWIALALVVSEYSSDSYHDDGKVTVLQYRLAIVLTADTTRWWQAHQNVDIPPVFFILSTRLLAYNSWGDGVLRDHTWWAIDERLRSLRRGGPFESGSPQPIPRASPHRHLRAGVLDLSPAYPRDAVLVALGRVEARTV
jgi:hypothetical protein